MEIYSCTFIFTINYIKSTNAFDLPLEVLWKRVDNGVIGRSHKKPTMVNNIAWFSQKIQFQSKLLFQPKTQSFQDNLLIVQVHLISPDTLTTFKKIGKIIINLAKVMSSNEFSNDKMYKLQAEGNNLIANFSIVCRFKESLNAKKDSSLERLANLKKDQVQRQKSVNAIKKNLNQEKNGENKSEKQGESLQQEKCTKAGNKKQENQEDRWLVISQQLQEIKQKFEQERQVNCELREEIKQLNEQISGLRNENDALCLSSNKKDNQIYEFSLQIESLKSQTEYLKRNQSTGVTLRHQKQSLEEQIQKLNEVINSNKIQLVKKKFQQQNLQKVLGQREKEILQYKQKEVGLVLKTESLLKENDLLKQKQKERVQQIKYMQNKIQSFRQQFMREKLVLESQISSLQNTINGWQKNYDSIFLKYKQYADELNSVKERYVEKQRYDALLNESNAKLSKYKNKQQAMKQNMQIIEDQISNLYQLIEEKEQNEEKLIEKIKYLQDDILQLNEQNKNLQNILKLSHNNLDKSLSNQEDHMNDSGLLIDNKDLLKKNKQLLQLLQTNSSSIIESEKIKKTLAKVKREKVQMEKRESDFIQQIKELKNKISILMKENKKLVDKNHKSSKQIETYANKQADELEKLKEMQLKQKDYVDSMQILQFKIQKLEESKERLKKEINQLRNEKILMPMIQQSIQQDMATSSLSFIKKETQLQKIDQLEQSNINHNISILQQTVKLLKDQQKSADTKQLLILYKENINKRPIIVDQGKNDLIHQKISGLIKQFQKVKREVIKNKGPTKDEKGLLGILKSYQNYQNQMISFIESLKIQIQQ